MGLRAERRNPLPWQASAKDLLEAADAVKSRVHNLGGGMMHSLAAVQAMLLGLAIECLLKGMWIKKKQPWIDQGVLDGKSGPSLLLAMSSTAPSSRSSTQSQSALAQVRLS